MFGGIVHEILLPLTQYRSLLLLCFRSAECVSSHTRADFSEGKVAVHRRRTWCGAVLTKTHQYRSFWPWWLPQEGAEGAAPKMCHHLEAYCCCSKDPLYWAISPGRSLGSEILPQWVSLQFSEYTISLEVNVMYVLCPLQYWKCNGVQEHNSV